MVLNMTSKKQESSVGQALTLVIAQLEEEFQLELHHASEWPLQQVIGRLAQEFPEVPFAQSLPRSSMRPDGGILSIIERTGERHPILITEVKNQGRTICARERG